MVRQDCLSRHEAGHLLASKLRPRLRPTCSDPKQPRRLSNLVELTPGPSQSGPQQGRMDGTSRTLSHEQWHGFNRWSESLSGNLPGARIGMVLRAPRRGKQVSRYQPEPGEYVAGQEGIALLEQNRLIRRCMNPHRAHSWGRPARPAVCRPGSTQPAFASSRPWCCSCSKSRRPGGKIGDRLAGTLAPWQPPPGSERGVGNVDLT